MFNFIKRYIKRNYGIDKEYYRFIDDMFGFVPGNIELYKVALIHKSASQSIGGHHINNERLEYLGDAVIESITSDYLFIAYPDRDEGFLTQMRSKIVSRQSLNEMAVCVGLDKYLICKSGATLQQKHIYGDAFEAMMGAIYLDKGYEFTNRLLINDIYERFLSIDELSEHESDFKSRLIEWCQKNRHSLEFRTSKGIDRKSSAPIFYTTVFIDRIEMGHGTGDSKKSSEQSAACSVTREMSDEECAKLLDKFDKLMDGEEQKNLRNSGKGNRAETANKPETDNGGNKPAEGESKGEAKGEGRRRRGRKRHNSDSAGDKPAAAEPEVKAESATDVETLPTEEPSQPKRSRRGRKKSAETATEEPARQSAGNAEAESAAADPAPQTETAELTEQTEQTAKRRRGGRKRSEQTAAETPADIPASVTEEPAGEAESQAQAEDKKPAKRRRSPRKKTEPTAETAATESAATTEAAAAEQEAQPAKRRRTRRKKTEQTAEPEQAAASAETNAEAPAATD